MLWHVLDGEAGNKIVFIRKISDSPEQVSCSNFRAGFDAELGPPLCAVLVSNIEFWVCASFVFFEKSHDAVRLITLAARTIEKIAGRDITGIAPQHSLS